MEFNSLYTLVGTPCVWREQEQWEKLLKSLPGSFSESWALRGRISPSSLCMVPRASVPCSSSRTCRCSVRALRVHQGFSASPELCSTKWGHHNLSLCKLLLPSARTPPAQPWDQKDPHVLTLLLIALKVKSTSGGDTGLKQKFIRYTLYWETNPECSERRIVRFELSARVKTQKLFSSHRFNSGYR